MYVYPSKLIRSFYPSLIWRIPTTEKELFLTFDDGPTPGVTDKVLSLLNEYQAKATFFCIGRNIEDYPDLFQTILVREHLIGNHTYSHPNGWKTRTGDYIHNVDQFPVKNVNWFRPPYGQIKPAQISLLKEQYHIAMWSVLSRDYERSISKEKVKEVVLKKVAPGYIYVFHDSIKAADKMLYALKALLEKGRGEGYKFSVLRN
jgi:peptidoglycan/xylan/chitin deacetylase (PgdA/CDA1 family)